MEESIKYFQPDITDIRVGYECEINKSLFAGISEGWHKFTFNEFEQLDILNKNSLKAFRVPYLTKEQIEAEGWRSIHWREYLWEKGNKIIHFFNGQKEDVDDSTYLSTFTIHNSSKVLFEGECRCINDFRQIMKFLCIK